MDAEYYRLMKLDKEAISKYEKFIRDFPSNPTARFNYARLLLDHFQLKEAGKQARRAHELDPENVMFHEFYIQTLLSSSRLNEAEAEYDHLIMKHPDVNEYVYGKAILHLMKSDYTRAIADFDELERRIGFDEEISMQKKNLFVKTGNTAAAISELDRMKKSDPGTPKYDLMKIELLKSSKDSNEIRTYYEQLNREFEQDPMAQVALARYYLDRNETSQYHKYMEKIMRNKNLEADTKIALMLPTLQKIESDSNEKKQLAGYAKIITQESPDNMDALNLYADLLYFSGQPDEAMESYRKYVQRDSTKLNVWNQLIRICSEKQQHDSVVFYSRHCIKHFPDQAAPYFFGGVSFFQLKQNDSTIQWLSAGLPYCKDNDALAAQFYSILGDAYHAEKRYAESDSCFEKSLQLQPREAGTLNNYAYYLSLRKEKLDEAERMSKKSLELSPDSKSFLDTYGWILFQKGNYKQALIYIEKAIAANGQDDGTLFEHLGDVYFKLNDPEKAKANWKLARDKGEQNPVLLKKIQDGTYYE